MSARTDWTPTPGETVELARRGVVLARVVVLRVDGDRALVSGRVLPFVRGPQAWPELRPQPELFIRRVGGGA